MPLLQSWYSLWIAYPDYQYFPDSKAVKEDIGGTVNVEWITNTCAVRMSRALNKNGVLVPINFNGLSTLKGRDERRYAYRVAEMRKWLEFALGKPDVDVKKQANSAFDKSSIASMKGIIAFDISFTDATGHLDMWNGVGFSSEYKTSKDYWTAATRVSLWKAVK